MVSYSEESKLATQKFFAFLRAYKERLSIRLTGLRNELVFFDAIGEFQKSNNLNDILHLSSFEGLDEDVATALKEIKDNKTSVLQYQSAMSRIKSNEKVLDLKQSILSCKTRIKACEYGIEVVDKILSDVPVNNEALIKLLDSSSLTEEEVLLVLKDYTYTFCPDYERTYEIPEVKVPEVPATAYDDPISKNEEFYSLFREYLDLKTQAEEFYKKYSFLIDSDDINTKARRIENGYLVQILESKFDVRREIPYDEKLAILMYQLQKILEEMKSNRLTKKLSVDELLELKFNISTLSSLLKLSTQLEKKVFPNKESSQRIIFLTDDKEEPLFNFGAQEFSSEDKKKVRSILYRLGNTSIIEDERISTKIIGTTKKNHIMRVIQESDLRCSFVRLSKDIILVITFDKSEDVYSKTIRYDGKYYEKIEALKNLAISDSENLIEITTPVTQKVYDSVSSTEKKIGGE